MNQKLPNQNTSTNLKSPISISRLRLFLKSFIYSYITDACIYIINKIKMKYTNRHTCTHMYIYTKSSSVKSNPWYSIRITCAYTYTSMHPRLHAWNLVYFLLTLTLHVISQRTQPQQSYSSSLFRLSKQSIGRTRIPIIATLFDS